MVPSGMGTAQPPGGAAADPAAASQAQNRMPSPAADDLDAQASAAAGAAAHVGLRTKHHPSDPVDGAGPPARQLWSSGFLHV